MDQDTSPEVFESIIDKLAQSCQEAIRRSSFRRDIDLSEICSRYVDTIVNMMLPKTVISEQTALYRQLYESTDEHQSDAIRRQLAEYGEDKDIITIRMQAVSLLRKRIDPQYHDRFDVALDYKPRPRVIMVMREVGDKAMRGYQAAQAYFIANL